MKKIQMMLAMMLMAFVGFALQSCGSDDNDDPVEKKEKFTVSVEIVNKGNMSDAEVAEANKVIKEQVESKIPANLRSFEATEAQAKAALDAAVLANKSEIENGFAEVSSFYNFTFAFILRDSNGNNVYERRVQVGDNKVIIL